MTLKVYFPLTHPGCPAAEHILSAAPRPLCPPSNTGMGAFSRRGAERAERNCFYPQNTQKDADEELLFRICVNRRVLRANPDSVAALLRCALCIDSQAVHHQAIAVD